MIDQHLLLVGTEGQTSCEDSANDVFFKPGFGKAGLTCGDDCANSDLVSWCEIKPV